MCGIGAVFGRKLENGESIIRKSLEAITHRGYSLFEIMALPHCALGANRLEIVDAQNARQPQTNEDGTVFVVFNGEIYNFQSLRSELSGTGHAFRTESDSEVLAHLWEEYGAGMVEKLDSEMFAFVIFDKRKETVFAARDPYGVKPLYYADDSCGNRHFASEIKQLAQFREIERIMEFPPGHYMIDGKFAGYHEIPKPGDVTHEDAGDIVSNLRTLFDAAVKKRVDTDLPVGVLFSGGLDSAAVLATARKYSRNVIAITVAHRKSQDRIIAERYCDECGIELKVRDSLDDTEMARRTPDIIRIVESYEPAVIMHAAAYDGIAKLARDSGLRVVLCGEGADEILGGYELFEQAADDAELSGLLYSFAANLPRTQFQRLDRITMSHTLEARAPFLDTHFADYAMRIPGALRVNPGHGYGSVKWVFREAMKDRLPEYIIGREKLPLHRGPDVHTRSGGYMRAEFRGAINADEIRLMAARHPGWKINDEIEAYAFRIFAGLQYTKADFSKERLYAFIPRRTLLERIRFWAPRIIRGRISRFWPPFA
ncbi:asparagine synthase-related protein [Candidatus Micrarchaeota archaeon]|nr:asparagine synthase-related protein [Candidatus Micrarchaeota archaeon]